MYVSIAQLVGKPGFPASYNGTKKVLESRGCTRRLKAKGKGVEYLVGLDLIKDIDSRPPTPTKNYYSVEILFEKLQGKPGIPQTISGLRRRIKNEEWESRKREGKGGGFEYLAPKDLFIEKPKLSLVPALDLTAPAPIDIKVGAERKAYRLEIVKQCSQWCDENGIKIGHREGDSYWSGIEQFCTAYNSQNSDQLCINTVARWWQIAMQRQSPEDLSGKQGQHLKGKTLIDSQPKVLEVVLARILDRPSHTLWQLQQKFAGNPDIKVPSYQSIVRWRDRWFLQNRPGYVYLKKGKTVYESTIAPALGTHDRDMDYANQKWEMDGTKVNVITKDGKRYTIMVFIDCFSRRVVTQIVDSSSGHAAAIGLHKAMMKMGKPEIISTDNGSEFKNTQIEEALLSIGVILHFCNPGKPKEKPLVERVHGTIATQLFELLPGSIGHDVAERKRLEETTLKEGERLTREELEQQLTAWESYYNSHLHRTIKMSPLEKWATSKQEITKFSQTDSDALLERMTRKTEKRVVQNKGIEARNQWWYDIPGDVALLVGRRVRISINPEETEMRVWLGEDFIGVARPHKSYSTEQQHIAKVNAKKKVNDAKNESIQVVKQAKKDVELLTYVDVTPIDNVTPIGKNKKVEPEVLAKSHGAIEKMKADDLAHQEQQVKRAKQRAAEGEKLYDKMMRIHLLVEANTATEDDLIWYNHNIENNPIGRSTLENVLDSLDIERSA
jgi:putative transposase